MKNITKKIVASSMLALFTLTNTLTAGIAMEDIRMLKPVIRDNATQSLPLKGDITYIKSSEPVNLSLRDSDVRQVLRMFADKAGLNIIFHDSVSGKVTLDLVNVPLNEAFDMVMGITNSNYIVQDDTIIVTGASVKDFNMAKQNMTFVPVKYVNAGALATFLNTNIFKMNKPGISNAEIVTTNPATNELIVFGTPNDVTVVKKVVEIFDKKPNTSTFKVNHTTPEEMANMICNMLIPASGTPSGTSKKTSFLKGIMTGAASSTSSNRSSSGSSSSFSSSSSSSSGGSSGSGGSNLSLNSGKVACTMDASMNGSFGVQSLSVSYYPQLGTVGILGGSESQLEMIKNFIQETDKKTPQAYLEVSIIELNEEGSKELSNNWKIWSKYFSASFEGSSLSTNANYPVFLAGDVNPEKGTIKKYSGPLTITYAIDYLIKNGKGRVVVNPRIIITNGVESKIEVTQDYLESVSVNASTSTGGTVVTRNYNISNDQGVTLSITPFISPDGYVTLKLKPEYSTPIGDVEGQETAGDNTVTYKAATLLSHRNLDLQNVRIKDNETLVIAGMIQEYESKTVNKIPVLGDIPFIGTVFRSTTSSKQKSEMLIMLTPKILTDNEDAIGYEDTL